MRDAETLAERLFAKAVDELLYLVERQKTLASRVVEADKLARDVERLHSDLNQRGEIGVGVDAVLIATGKRVDPQEWRRPLEKAKRDHRELLREAIRTAREDLRRDSSLARETIVLLNHARVYARWNPLADELWEVVKPLVSRSNEPLDVPVWFIPESDIVFRSRTVDRGSFGTVHHAVWNGCRVVVMVVQNVNIHQTKQLKRFVNEVEIGFNLSHPHVVKLYGACHTRAPPLIVCEFAKEGNLSEFLFQRGRGVKWRLLREAALGLQFLHSKQIVHGDLKLSNILVMADRTAKVADFGLSRKKGSQTASMLNDGTVDGASAIRWRAPECFRTKPTFASDVYSFAMCIYEAVAGTIPYDQVPSNNVVEELICEGQLPHRPEELDDSVWGLIEKMTRAAPEKRMTVNLSSRIVFLRVLSSPSFLVVVASRWRRVAGSPSCS